MNYYILTQGTKSDSFKLIIKNGKILESTNTEREGILKLFNSTEEKGKKINSIKSKINIIKHNKNFLIGIISTNTDRLDRKVPIDLLLENYNETSNSKNGLDEAYFLLSSNDVNVDESIWKSLIPQLNQDLQRFRKIKSIKLLIGLLLIIISTIVILKII